MKKHSRSQSAFFNPRVLIAFSLCAVGSFMAMISFGATPTGAWSIVDSPNTSYTQDNWLHGVTCASATDCWAVGFRYIDTLATSGETLIQRWDGTSWAKVASPNGSGAQYNELYGVTCVSPTDCWAVGTGPSEGSITQALIEHWNGSLWAVVTSPNTSSTQDNVLSSVTCVSASDCWAVGYYNNGGVHQTLIERWDGTAWSIVTSDNRSSTQHNRLSDVTCASATDCWAVGDYSNGSVSQTLIEHWNGILWDSVASANTSSTQSNWLNGVTCASAMDCWVVGKSNNGSIDQTLIERWDGISWGIVTSGNTSSTEANYLNGVTCASATDCWAVGGFNNGSVGQTLIEHWDGTEWLIAASPNVGTSHNGFEAVTCTSAFDCWAVGLYSTGAEAQTLIERYTPLVSVVSTKTHGSAGAFDIDLPLTGTRGIESRSGGPSGHYTMVFTFMSTVTGCGVATTSDGSMGMSVNGPNSNQCTVDLMGVTNARYMTLTLNGVVDSQNNTGNVFAKMGVLIGDVTANGAVSNTDLASVKAQVAAPVTISNFRNDVSANGVISNTDVALVKAQVGNGLP